MTTALALLAELEAAQEKDLISDQEIIAMFHSMAFCAEEAARHNFDPQWFKETFTQFVIDEVAKR
jgi:hypothetical protein